MDLPTTTYITFSSSCSGTYSYFIMQVTKHMNNVYVRVLDATRGYMKIFCSDVLKRVGGCGTGELIWEMLNQFYLHCARGSSEGCKSCWHGSGVGWPEKGCGVGVWTHKAVHKWFMNHENFGKNAILQYLAVQIKICKIYWTMRLPLRYLLLCYVGNVLSLYKP